MKIQRLLLETILQRMQEAKKAVLLYGARQVGKTTLAEEVLQQFPEKQILSLSGDDERYHTILSSRNAQKIANLIGGTDILFLDEAQRIPDIGINLKIIIDQFPEIRLLVTGSSSFELKNQLQEPLTGRVWSYTLYPMSFQELANIQSRFDLNDQREHRMLYGSYPEVFSLPNNADREEYLRSMSESYLYKDIFEITSIRYPDKIKKLLKLLAFQIGQECSLSELAQKIETSKETVAHYLDLLEKSFVIFRLSGFSKNLRKEVTKMDKIYFWDLGIRNAVLGNFDPLDERNDQGALWENLLIAERLKKNVYTRSGINPHFWRLYSGAEIDYVEEKGGHLNGFEIKTKPKDVRPPKSWQETYPEASFGTIHPENFLDFVL